MIPEELWNVLVLDETSLDHDLALISERDAAIRAEEREQHRLEVVAEIEAQAATWEHQCFDQRSAVNQFTLELKNKLSLQPTKPKVHPRAVELAEKWFAETSATELSKHRLAALISNEVKADGWRE